MKAVKAKQKSYLRIVEELKQDILSHYSPGETLSTEMALCQRFDVSRMTVRKALNVLEEQGHVERHHGRGTIVADRSAKGTLAVVVSAELLDSNEFPYYRLACNAIVKTAYELCPLWHTRFHVGKPVSNMEEFPASLDILSHETLKTLRGVISFHYLSDLEDRLADNGIPLLHLGPKGKPRIWFDQKAFIDAALLHLREVGCRSVTALIALKEEFMENYCQELIKRGEYLGIKCHPQKMKIANEGFTEKTAYEFFMEYWQNSKRPEALLIMDDVFCHGVLRGIVQLGIRLPDDIRLITYANAGVPFPYHKPLTRYEFDPAKQARTGIRILRDMLQGRSVESQILCKGCLIKGKTT